MLKRISFAACVLLAIAWSAWAEPTEVTWEWTHDSSATVSYRYQMDRMKDDGWIPIESDAATFTLIFDDASEHIIFFQQSTDGGEWSTAEGACAFLADGSENPVSVTWEWALNDPEVTAFRYQLDGEEEGGWTVTDAKVRSYTMVIDKEEAHTLYLQQSYDGVHWSLSTSASYEPEAALEETSPQPSAADISMKVVLVVSQQEAEKQKTENKEPEVEKPEPQTEVLNRFSVNLGLGISSLYLYDALDDYYLEADHSPTVRFAAQFALDNILRLARKNGFGLEFRFGYIPDMSWDDAVEFNCNVDHHLLDGDGFLTWIWRPEKEFSFAGGIGMFWTYGVDEDSSDDVNWGLAANLVMRLHFGDHWYAELGPEYRYYFDDRNSDSQSIGYALYAGYRF